MIKLIEIRDLEKDVPTLIFQNEIGKIAIVPIQKHIADYLCNALAILKTKDSLIVRNNENVSEG
jgi:hypothetical protein